LADTQIAVTEKNVAQYVKDMLPKLSQVAIRQYDANIWGRTVLLCILQNPKLMAALATESGRMSLKNALLSAAATGLSLNPQEGKACLIAYGDKIEYQIEKGGYIDLALDNGAVKTIRANAVRENDHWKPMETDNGDSYEFGPAKTKRGEIVGFFSAVKMRDGQCFIFYMTREEVEDWRDKYGNGVFAKYDDTWKPPRYKKGDRIPDSAWGKSFEGMGVKTVVKLQLRRLALAPRKVQEKLDEMEQSEIIPADFEEQAPKPEKGASASEVEAKLKAAQPAQDKMEVPAPDVQSGPHPDAQPAPAASAALAGAPAASAAPGAPGSMEQPELGLPGGTPKDIF